MLKKDRSIRIFAISASVLGLIALFIFQRFDYSQLFFNENSEMHEFIFNRTLRFILNDNLMIILIYGLFYEKKYIKFALLVELFGFLFLLIPYFALRYGSSIDHMYISFLHRLIVNPTLMILLIPAIYINQKGS